LDVTETDNGRTDNAMAKIKKNKDKQRSTKHYTENLRLSEQQKPTKIPGVNSYASEVPAAIVTHTMLLLKGTTII
jgi:hypothetical protein